MPYRSHATPFSAEHQPLTAERFSSSFFGPSTLVNLLRHRAPSEAVCYTYRRRRNEELHLTNAELDRQARAIAARLQGMGLEGERRSCCTRRA